MTTHYGDISPSTNNARKIEHELEYRLANGQPLRSALHDEIHKLRQLDSYHGRLNRPQFQKDLREIDHDLHQKRLLPHMHIATYGEHLGRLVHDPHAHAQPPHNLHLPAKDPALRQHLGAPHQGKNTAKDQTQVSPLRRALFEASGTEQVPALRKDDAGESPSTVASEPDLSEILRPWSFTPTPPREQRTPPHKDVPPVKNGGDARPEQEVSPQSDAPPLSNLKAAIERAKAGGRSLTIAQFGDSHIQFGTETPALVGRLAADSGLQSGQVRFSSFGDVGKTATYANEHPEEFLRNINRNTDLVIVSFGSNESGAQAGSKYANDYAQLIDKVRQKAPQASIVMVGPTDGNFWNTNRHLPYLRSVVDAQKSVAATIPNSAYIDVLDQMPTVQQMRSKNPPLMQPDNLHLTTDGYRLLGKIIADDVQSVLNQR